MVEESTWIEAVFFMTFIWPIYGAWCWWMGAFDILFNNEIGEFYTCIGDRMDDYNINY